MANPFPISVQRTLEEVAATLPVFMKGFLDLSNRNRVMRPILERSGSIVTSSDMTYAKVWNIADTLPEVSEIQNGPGTYEPVQNLDQMSMIPRYKEATTSLQWKEWEENQMSGTQLVNLMDKRVKDTGKALNNHFNAAIFLDGGTGDNLSGVESFFASNGSATVADKIALPSDSYGGQSTVLGNAGGNWDTGTSPYNTALTTTWPIGQGDPRYDRCSPLLMNIGSTAYGSGTGSWRADCEEIMTLTADVQLDRNGRTRNEGMRIHLLSMQLYNDLKESLKTRNWVSEPGQEAMDYGIKGTFNYEGCEVATDSDVPVGVGYLLDCSMIEFHTSRPSLISPMSADAKESLMWNELLRAYIGTWVLTGNFRHQPKFHAKYANFVA